MRQQTEIHLNDFFETVKLILDRVRRNIVQIVRETGSASRRVGGRDVRCIFSELRGPIVFSMLENVQWREFEPR